MGIVRKESVRISLIRYLALPLGFIASIYIYPYSTETTDAYGVYNYIVSFATFLMPFIFIGIPNLSIRYFNEFKDETNGNNGFLRLLLRNIAIAVLIVIPLIYLLFHYFLNDRLFGYNGQTHYLMIFGLSVIMGLTALFTYYLSNFKKNVIPNLLETIKSRMMIPVLILILGLGFLGVNSLMYLLVFAFLIQLLLLIFYTKSLGELHLSKVNPSKLSEYKREMKFFSLYALLGATGGNLTSQIDAIMITELVDIRSNGIYSIGRNISNSIAIPTMAVYGVMAPIIAAAFSNNDMESVKTSYQRASNVLLITGSLIFLGVSVIMDDILLYMNKSEIDFSELKFVFIALGISIVFNMLTSINAHIIIYSKYYRFNVILILILGLLNIVFNYYFIKVLDYGIIGAAYASALSIVVHDTIKSIFIYVKFKLHPFTKQTLTALVLLVSMFLFLFNVDFSSSNLINIIVKECIIGLLFLGMIFMKLSPDINEFINDVLKRFRKKS